jgi:monothiol glutaredoxin
MMSETQEKIKTMVEKDTVFLFMKGTPDAPQCGFSMRSVQILRQLEVPFGTCNVLEDPEVRQGIKEYSQWPTIPQLYISGQFVGGSDIMMEMFQSGELEQTLQFNE